MTEAWGLSTVDFHWRTDTFQTSRWTVVLATTRPTLDVSSVRRSPSPRDLIGGGTIETGSPRGLRRYAASLKPIDFRRSQRWYVPPLPGCSFNVVQPAAEPHDPPSRVELGAPIFVDPRGKHRCSSAAPRGGRTRATKVCAEASVDVESVASARSFHGAWLMIARETRPQRPIAQPTRVSE